jgi:Ca2+:H+ antiporter
MGQLLTGQRQSAINTHTGDVSFSGSGKGSMPRNERSSTHLGISHESTPRTAGHQDNLQAITGYTADEVNRAFEVVAATASALQSQQQVQPAAPGTQQPQGLPRSFSAGNNLSLGHMSTPTPTLRRQASHMHNREISKGETAEDSGGGGHGGHDAPNWSRFKSYSVLFGCTVLYAIIAGMPASDACPCAQILILSPSLRNPGRCR